MLGIPGSGKTTAGAKLAEHLSMPFRSMGDVLRAGRARNALPIDTTDPATDYLLLELLRAPAEFTEGFVLDFSPVQSDGGDRLVEMLREQGFGIIQVVYVQVMPRIAEERYVQRGQRPGDPTDDIRAFFRKRIVEEFWPFTLPLVRRAHKAQQLLVLNNAKDESLCIKESERAAYKITALL